MKIHGVKLENFMLFDKLDAEFSPNVNIICGENSTGKTALIKLLYACVKDSRNLYIWTVPWKNLHSSEVEKNRDILTETRGGLPGKIASVFGLESLSYLSDLVALPFETECRVAIDFEADKELKFIIRRPFSFSFPETPPVPNPSDVVYIPPKEMISSVENFASLYEEFHLHFDETYYDLTRLLDRPRKKTFSPQIGKVIQHIESLIGGKVLQKGKAFYLDMDGVGELRMSLVSEGYRKLATLLNLVSTGSLSDGAILFWDEPETNMNPRMVEPLVKAILALAGAGVQVFVTTHDYFVQQYFGLAAEYGEQYQADTGKLEYRFLSLNKTRTADGAETVTLESASRLADLERNAIAEEFDAVYDREQGLIYGDDA